MSLFRRCLDDAIAIRRGAKGTPAPVRAIALLSLLKSVLFLVSGLVIGRFIDHEGAQLMLGLAHVLHVDPEAQPVVHTLHWLTDVNLKNLQMLDLVCFAYTALYLIQALGLWFDRWWAEWLTVIMSSLLVPFEIHELFRHPGAPVALTLLLNLLVVGYLIFRLRKKKQMKLAAMAAAPAAPAPPG